MSIPTSRSASIASGLTRDGSEPALWTRTRSPNFARARPSAIWLRAEFATHRKRIDRRLGMVVILHGDVDSRVQGGNSFLPQLATQRAGFRARTNALMNL